MRTAREVTQPGGPSTTLVRLTAIAAAAVMTAAGFAAGAAHAQDSPGSTETFGSAGSSVGPGFGIDLSGLAQILPFVNASVDGALSNNDPSLTRTVTRTHGNISLVHQVVGNNVGSPGTPVTYRTTISATEGPTRQVTRIAGDTTGYLAAPGYSATAPRGARVTYTTPDGGRVTEKLTPTADAAGHWGASAVSWPVDATTGATVVYEITYEWNGALGSSESTEPKLAEDSLYLDVTGLDPLEWSPTGLQVVCPDGCHAPTLPTGS